MWLRWMRHISDVLSRPRVLKMLMRRSSNDAHRSESRTARCVCAAPRDWEAARGGESPGEGGTSREGATGCPALEGAWCSDHAAHSAIS